jgi:hypothetical protein
VSTSVSAIETNTGPFYDISRGFGIYYDKSQSTPSRPAALQTIMDLDDAVLRSPASIHSEDEQRYPEVLARLLYQRQYQRRKTPFASGTCRSAIGSGRRKTELLPNAEHLQKTAISVFSVVSMADLSSAPKNKQQLCLDGLRSFYRF